jgi:hypothetical protein
MGEQERRRERERERGTKKMVTCALRKPSRLSALTFSTKCVMNLTAHEKTAFVLRSPV